MQSSGPKMVTGMVLQVRAPVQSSAGSALAGALRGRAIWRQQPSLHSQRLAHGLAACVPEGKHPMPPATYHRLMMMEQGSAMQPTPEA